LDSWIPLIDQRLNELIGHSNEALQEAMKYSLLGPGKRFRPQLVLASAETFGAPLANALDPACAIEMIHAYSLIHDDLPCMDNDDFRRGRPTLHRVYSEGMAVLAGDALLTEAFYIIAKASCLDGRQIARLIALLAERAGKTGMVGGQAIDILLKQNSTIDLLIQMDQKKTGDLFSCALEFGAIIANASPAIQKHLREIGLHLGLAYQIRDDQQDETPQPLADSNHFKPTLTSCLGTDSTKVLLQRTVDTIHRHLSFLPQEAPAIKNLISKIVVF
jgi:geranylgeranyl diphosphate synthase type II